jgi:hypothetical protein
MGKHEPNGTRRKFLTTSAGTVISGAAVPYFWTSFCAKAESKNDRPVVALIGAGVPTSWGSFQNVEPPKHLDWDFWLGQAPKVPYCPQRCHLNFRWWFEYGGGQVTDWGVHFVDIAQWALGCENTGPVEIEGTGEFPNIPNGYNTAVAFDCTLTFAGGSKIVFRSVPKGTSKGVLIEGENGRIFVNRGRLSGKPIEEFSKSDKEWLDDEVANLYRGKQPGDHMRNFFECLKDRSLPISDVFTHHRTVSSCHLSNIALRLGRSLRWDPEKEDFIGDEQASAMLSRKQREPYTVERLTGPDYSS